MAQARRIFYLPESKTPAGFRTPSAGGAGSAHFAALACAKCVEETRTTILVGRWRLHTLFARACGARWRFHTLYARVRGSQELGTLIFTAWDASRPPSIQAPPTQNRRRGPTAGYEGEAIYNASWPHYGGRLIFPGPIWKKQHPGFLREGEEEPLGFPNRADSNGASYSAASLRGRSPAGGRRRRGRPGRVPRPKQTQTRRGARKS